MELKEKLRQILKERYGIENDAEIIKEARMISTRRLLRLLREQQLQGQHSGKNRRRRKACY